MLDFVILGEYSEREGYKGSEYAPTYEDKDGDWMLVGDVPWDKVLTLFCVCFVSMYRIDGFRSSAI
jgi:hypothetical protein